MVVTSTVLALFLNKICAATFSTSESIMSNITLRVVDISGRILFALRREMDTENYQRNTEPPYGADMFM